MIHHGDCREWLPSIESTSIDMCYIDPPFGSDSNLPYSTNVVGDYIEWMTPIVQQIHRCLKDTGSIFLHCDWRASHRLRVMLDEVFGDKNFVNEIIWCYSGPGNSPNFFPRKHDTIFFYSKGDKPCFYQDKARIAHKRQKPSKGKGDNCMASGKRTIAEIKALELKWLKRGKAIEDWWGDIPSGCHMSRNELMGYKTQKPEKLLDRIIQCSTQENDTVLDCFVGSGTTAVVAAKLNRQFIVGDIAEDAIRYTKQRLQGIS